ncbi:MAG: phosphoribosylformylglycinamidine synthase [Bacteroidales bacterium]|nr:phosphoribosylformylglycinamidine synthase [Bacteroidales bacterium]
MVIFFENPQKTIIAVQCAEHPSRQDTTKFIWLFDNAKQIDSQSVEGYFFGPRREMITPWSTNAVEITQNMGIKGVVRIEQYFPVKEDDDSFDPMLQAKYHNLDQNVFFVDIKPEPLKYITDIEEYNQKEGLALSQEEIDYLKGISKKIGRGLTDSEVYGFAQVNSEHCRHKIFNGSFIIDGKEMPETLFALIKKTSKVNRNRLVSAYKDNVAFILGPKVEQFAPATQHKADYFRIKDIDTVISLKAETHNFPTTVEPFNGAATGTGGEIRDRLAGGRGSIPLAGTAVYMTSYPRNDSSREWEDSFKERPWLYQTPEELLIKASNGASDFGNKFGQPLINGSLLTFEHSEGEGGDFGYDKVIMEAGGIGFAPVDDSIKEDPEPGDLIIVLGGDNYRIGMGGAAVSSVGTGQYSNAIELNAVQRANPEMQKRVANVIRAMVENDSNPVRSIHDHGAGGHLNCLSELIDKSGGVVYVDNLPVGDPTLSDKEIIGNESQERMGLLVNKADTEVIRLTAERERAPYYMVGESTDDQRLRFTRKNGVNPIDLSLSDFFGSAPKTVLTDTNIDYQFRPVEYKPNKFVQYLQDVLQIEAVSCKDWLTNKVDRSVTGRVAMQQCAGAIQLPLNDLGIMALDYQGVRGIGTALGHAPAAALISPEAGSHLSVAEALTNLVWAPIEENLKGVSLSANWMWPAKNTGENARLYRAVKALSDFCLALGVNVPTGKDSLSMTQKYPNGQKVLAPGTVIVTAAGEVTDVKKAVRPVMKVDGDTRLLYINFSKDSFKLGGSSFAQTLSRIGEETPDVKDTEYFKLCFNTLQQLIEKGLVIAGHDVSAGGLITTLLEMTFANCEGGLNVDLSAFDKNDLISVAFSEQPAVVIQVKDKAVEKILNDNNIEYQVIAKPIDERVIALKKGQENYSLDIDSLRDLWYKSSYLLDAKQSGDQKARERFRNYKKQDLRYDFGRFTGKAADLGIDMHRRTPSGVKAAIIREKGVNGDREMAYALYLAGFDVKDVHTTDLISGREDLTDVNMIVFVGGFSNSDVLGSAKGWAGALLFNEKARNAIMNFYKRPDTMSLGVCNGCQLMTELHLIYPNHDEHIRMLHNDSHKFESNFVNVNISYSNSIMLSSLKGRRLGVWVAHGEGKFNFPYFKDKYNIAMSYSFDEYPGNPNGSDWSVAAICSNDGRHLAMMPHLERAFLPWQWPYYPEERKNDEVSPWIEAFVNALNWIKNNKN